MRCVAFTPDGRTLASAAADTLNPVGTVKLWDPATGQERLGLSEQVVCPRCLAFGPDGRVLAVAGRGGQRGT